MSGKVSSTKDNIIVYLILIAVCFVFGFIYTGLSNWLNILGWVFVILTAGLFFFSGGNFVNEGHFHSTSWKIVFVLLLPLYLFVDNLLIVNITWYDMYCGTAYYALFTLGFLFKKIPKYY